MTACVICFTCKQILLNLKKLVVNGEQLIPAANTQDFAEQGMTGEGSVEGSDGVEEVCVVVHC